jgi:hypothetical protein
VAFKTLYVSSGSSVIVAKVSSGGKRYAGSRAISGRVAIIIDPSGCDDRRGDQRSSLLQDGQSMQ